jgi:hypothetical protein
MKVKSNTLQDYVKGKINEINSMQNVGNLGLTEMYVRDSPIKISGLPAWRIEFTSSFGGVTSLYSSTNLLIKDNRLFTLEFHGDPLKAPETLPIAQKMIDSFEIIP